MCKAVQRDIVLTDIRLLSNTGGIHGDYVAIDKNKSEKWYAITGGKDEKTIQNY